MDEKQETIADILEELRSGEYAPLADRLEAAWKREKAAIEADALAVGGLVEASRATTEKSSAVGDAAKLREAVIETQSVIAKCMDILNEIPDGCGYNGLIDDVADELCDLRNGCLKDALAAPPRNCDVMSLAVAKKVWYLKEIVPRLIGDLPLGKEIPFEEWFVAPATEQKGGNNVV